MLREHWDRALFYTALAGYGLVSLFHQGIGSMAQSPRVLSTPIYVMFVLAGVLLTIGWFGDRRSVYLLGNGVGVAALVGVIAVVLAVSAGPGSLLVTAVGLALVIMLRRNRRDNRMLDELRSGWRRETSGP